MDSKAINKIKQIIISVFRILFLFSMCYIILKPFATLILSAFMSPDDLLDIRVEKIPANWSLYYWKHALDVLGIKNFLNSFYSAMVNSILQVITSIFVGYGLSRFKFKGKNILLFFVIAIMIIPFQVYNIPQYLMFRNFLFFGNLIDTPYALFTLSALCLGLKHSLYIYVVMNCFNGLPKELEEASYIDGAGIFKTFKSVMLPNVRNVIVTIFLLSFSWGWTDIEFVGHLNNSTNNLPSVILSSYMKIFNVQSSEDILGTTISQGAAVILIILPLIAIFVVCQKSFVNSISHSGLAN